MTDEQRHTLVPGLQINTAGEVSVAPELSDTLYNLACDLEEDADLPVDVEHVVAAILLAVQQGEIDETRRISASDEQLRIVLARHVRTIFEEFDGLLEDDA